MRVSNPVSKNSNKNEDDREELLSQILYRIYSGMLEFQILAEFGMTRPRFAKIERSSLDIHFRVIFNLLNLNLDEFYLGHREELSIEFYELKCKLPNSRLYDRYYKIMPSFAYMTLRAKGNPISSNNLIYTLHLDRYAFFQMIKKLYFYIPSYSKRDKKGLIRKHIQKIKRGFDLPQEFTVMSNRLLEYVLPKMMTKERIISAVTCTLALLMMDYPNLNYSLICEELKVTPSAVIYHVKNSLFPKRTVSGVVKSKEVIQEALRERLK
ncbi:MAG: hypothetical protein P8Y97_19365 [Candidatus Lokiarchaeota archaeon]